MPYACQRELKINWCSNPCNSTTVLVKMDMNIVKRFALTQWLYSRKFRAAKITNVWLKTMILIGGKIQRLRKFQICHSKFISCEGYLYSSKLLTVTILHEPTICFHLSSVRERAFLCLSIPAGISTYRFLHILTILCPTVWWANANHTKLLSYRNKSRPWGLLNPSPGFHQNWGMRNAEL